MLTVIHRMLPELKSLLKASNPAFWEKLRLATREASSFEDLIALATLRKRAGALGLKKPEAEPLRIALIGGYTLYPFRELLEQ